ncbi:S-adenosyl-L-methionine-dependent methyltransferase [Rickenella mellea]|uniref:S-adenosyl-L-methionine-dependent methyltransferase n=1 Tax=Rickenella mellea TaxID=50990 RepID=A0A4Y7QAH2_9AGAM|nr:S-adenosyl-L-methionine-dependent methyltransferase [Rickenella mellea]
MAWASSLPKKNEDYVTKEYWDERYAKENDDGAFDWFKSYADIADLIREYVPDKASRILMLGCGNSKLSEEMYDDGYKNIVNVDYSGVVIGQMKKKHEESRPEMEWFEMDIQELSFGDESFDVAIDKGTMDAFLSAKGDVWNPPEEAVQSCTREVDEVLRVLKRSTGVFLYLTFAQPHFRKRFLIRPNTTLTIRELGEMFHYYLYILKV